MTEARSLRWRFIATYVLLAGIVCGCFAFAAFLAIQSIENVLIDKRLERAAGQVIERYQRGLRDDLPNNIDLYVGDEAPAPIRGLRPGIHEVDVDGKATHVLVRSVGGQTFRLADDESDYESIEVQIYLTLAGAFFMCIALAFVAGRVAAKRIIAPVTELASAVARDDPDRPLPALDAADEIGVLARAFAARTQRLHGFLERERSFVGDVSHEMRTPLTVILGAAEVLGARRDNVPEVSAIAERIRRTAAEATARVSAMLLLSRSPETLDLQPVALRPLIETEVERHRALVEGKPVRIDLQAESDVVVVGRSELIGIAVGNLIRNAFQCTERGLVSIVLTPGSLVVEDTGPGLPAAVRQRLFERLPRGEAKHASGSGFGLAIVRRVVESLRWQVQMFDRDGGGSRFVISFAVPPSTSQAEPAAPR